MQTLRFLLPFLIACGGGQTQTTTTTPTETVVAEPAPLGVASGDLGAAMAGAHRSDENRARDEFRHPRQTLEFFGLEPGMTVVEIHPGGGWYTEILAPYLREDGRLIAAGYDPEDPSNRGGYERGYRATLAEHPNVYDKVEHVLLIDGNLMEDVPDASADMVVSFRSVHNWMRDGADPMPILQAIARVLKPGGIFGVVQHRAPEGLEHGEDGSLGYLTEQRVISLIETAGFALEERSEVNANPNDTADHPEGVWSMPPGLRGEDETLRNLGESDRMTLRFRKPASEAPPEA